VYLDTLELKTPTIPNATLVDNLHENLARRPTALAVGGIADYKS